MLFQIPVGRQIAGRMALADVVFPQLLAMEIPHLVPVDLFELLVGERHGRAARLHHLHLRNPNPDEGFAWLLDKFGGKKTQLKGRLDGIRYDADGFSSVWILIQKGEAEPSTGRAIETMTPAPALSAPSRTAAA